MKAKINIYKYLIILTLAAAFFSCDNPFALGSMLDLKGPVVNITSPSPNKSVPAQFVLEGDIYDDNDIDRMLVKVVADDQEFQKQWRYLKGVWEISENKGQTWSPFDGAVWDGAPNSAKWSINIDMAVNGVSKDGEYTFSVQAWDKGQVSDDNSFKSIVIIIDHDPPKVDISNPYIYRGNKPYENPDSPLKILHDFGDDDDFVWKDPAYLGKFITQEFDLKWQIEDNYNLWSIDIRLYPYDVDIDNDASTKLPDSYIYKYFKNLPPPPPYINPNDYIRPNGSVTVPDLTSPKGVYDDGGEIRNPVTAKTTVKVVAACYDAAGNPNQEKTLGYFIYWPKANTPWIVFTEGMDSPVDKGYYGKPVGPDSPESIDEDVLMVYPGRSVKATAYQAHGVKEVKYTLYKLDISGNILHEFPRDIVKNEYGDKLENIIINNTEYSGTYTNIFQWEIKSPAITGYYLLYAQAFSSQGVSSEEYSRLFRVQDITFPNFPTPPEPPASDPLFMDIKDNKITICGIVDDATEVTSLCLVWINPQSEKYAAMNQLQYFRDKDYGGWSIALGLPAGKFTSEGIKDPDYPNIVWNLELTPEGIDNETNRKLYSYKQEIDLSLFEIGIEDGKQPLRSQIFLLRAENPDKKCTIITYAPQGDTLAPVITITNVLISGSQSIECFPGKYVVIEPFQTGDTITINGTWEEDSAEYLPISTYFLPNFKIEVNNQTLPKPVLNSDGTWTITSRVGSGALTEDNLKDTLVLNVSAKDIGGNKVEVGSSWLIQSDKLKLMRITAIDSARDKDGKEQQISDGIYTTGTKIDIVLEFSKPVKLAYTGSQPPQLILNAGTSQNVRASYKAGQTSQNSRQYFEYTVTAGNSTGGNNLNVTGLYHNGTVYGTGNAHTGADGTYPFAWYKEETNSGTTTREEVRLTMQANLDGNTLQTGGYYARTLPTTTVNTESDYQFTLGASKHLVIDTGAPTATVQINTPAGDYDTGNNITVTLNFSKPVAIGAAAPYVNLQIGSATVPAAMSGTVNNTTSSGSITFTYTIKTGDTSNGNQVSLTGFGGSITDLAGNPLASVPNTTLTGVYVDTIPLLTAPTVRLLSAANVANVVTNTVGGAPQQGLSTAGNKALATIYNDNLWLAIEGMTTLSHKLTALEYSFDNGNTWTSRTIAANPNNTPFQLTYLSGSYTVIARQKDKVGHTSPSSDPITFTWDRGNIISRIGSSTPDGTYTNNSPGTRADAINITVYFRKQVKFTAVPTITTNVTPTASATVSATYTTLNTPVTELTFTYNVKSTDNTPTNGTANLVVSAFNLNGGTATDETNVTVNTLITPLPTDNLTGKNIKVKTGALAVSTTAFTGSGTATEGYYNNTKLEITFSDNIIKGDGTISIIQSATDYRLPSVLTESQFNKYKGIANVNTYYSRGSNGYIYTSASDRKADTTTKYILRYDIDPSSTAAAPGSGTELQILAEAFRQAEKLSFSINAIAVTVSGNKLSVDLSGTNALQVPGASYLVTYPQGFVQNALDAPCPAVTNFSVALSGIAKPFIRIKKSQDTISTQTGTAANPSLVAIQPFTAEYKMDCRTPGSTIYYFETDAVTTTNAMNWTYNANPASNGPNDLNTPAAPAEPSNPETVTAGRLTYSTPQTLSSANDYQGLQWFARAKANKGSDWSVDSYEMAFKTVITYVIPSTMNAQDNGIAPGNGDQIWIRGGDAVGLSSVPGFPINWDVDEFETVKAEGKRAGIRLFTKTNNGNLNSDAIWKFITWEINVDTYFDIILGRDRTSDTNFVPVSSPEEALQYGPRQFAYQRAGWTSYKEQFRALPGKHRWLVCNNPDGDATKGYLNFSGTFGARPEYKGDDITFKP